MVISRPLEQCHIAVEGAIGVGKTTLAEKLAVRLASDLLLEDVSDNPFVELFYQDRQRHALSVQLSFLFSRIRQWQGIHQQELFNKGLVSDYIFAKDRLFANITLNDEELALYDQVARHISVDIPRPDLVIYLQADFNVLLKRTHTRSRAIERGITPDYLKEVVTAYDKFFFHYQETPLLIVQTDRLNFADRPEDIDTLIERIGDMRSGTEFWADYS